MTIVVTGATGKLGRLVVESLLARGTAPSSIVATGRNTAALADLVDRGVTVRVADLDDPATLDAAFAGATRLLLVSGSEIGRRVAQHTNAIEAAMRAGVELVAYTSGPKAETSRMVLLEEHRETERALVASGLPWVLLRNGWYVENYTDQIATHRAHGLVGAGGDGRVSVALRADYAEAAAVVLTGEGHAGATYELGGEAVTLPELAGLLGVTYTDVGVEALEGILLGAGLPAPLAHVLADADRGIADGELLVEGSDLEKLLGRAPVPAAEAVARALA